MGKALYPPRSETLEQGIADANEKHAMRYPYCRGPDPLTKRDQLTFVAINLKKQAM